MNYFVRVQSRLPSLKDNSWSFLLQENLEFKELVEGGGGIEKEKGSKQASGTNDAVLLWKMFAKIQAYFCPSTEQQRQHMHLDCQRAANKAWGQPSVQWLISWTAPSSALPTAVRARRCLPVSAWRSAFRGQRMAADPKKPHAVKSPGTGRQAARCPWGQARRDWALSPISWTIQARVQIPGCATAQGAESLSS